MTYGKIKMVNDFSCDIKEISSINLRTHDGSVCMLVGVRHILSISKNLISVSLLDSKSFKYSRGDEILSVYRSLDVILIDFIHGTFY